MSSVSLPSADALARLRLQKYGTADRMPWLIARRHRFGYALPADVYEGLVDSLVKPGMTWLDVGGGHDIFAHNPGLGRTLAARCGRIVAVDPSPNVLKNTFVHEAVQCLLEDFKTTETFDVATMRMVVEHVSQPESFTGALSRLVRPGGLVVVFTVNLWSPVTIVSRAIPFKFHHALKRYFWGGEEDDTFPTSYLMNTHASLKRHFEQAGFSEELFAKADDLSVFGHFRSLGYLELLGWRALHAVGLPYPERNLLAVYRRRASS